MVKKSKRRLWRLFLTDAFIFGVCLVVFALFHHVLERLVVPGEESAVMPTVFDMDVSRFATAETVEEGTDYYRDDTVFVTVKTVQADGAVYHIADVYLRDLSALKTAFATGEFVPGAKVSTLSMARENGAVFALSGDYCGIRERGVVIRNGKAYRFGRAHDVCVLYCDGTMETFAPATFHAEREWKKGIWQAWDFGPELLEKDGRARTSFSPGIAGKNPRCAIGYYAPGHYAFVAVDGRQEQSEGMTLSELAKLFEDLGCCRAYNLDGGHSAVMVWQGEMYSSPSKPGGRAISDIIYLPKKELS